MSEIPSWISSGQPHQALERHRAALDGLDVPLGQPEAFLAALHVVNEADDEVVTAVTIDLQPGTHVPHCLHQLFVVLSGGRASAIRIRSIIAACMGKFQVVNHTIDTIMQGPHGERCAIAEGR